MECKVKTAVIEIVGLVLYGVFAAHVALMSLLTGPVELQAPIIEDSRETVIYEDTRLLTVCVIGAFAGAVLNAFVSPMDVATSPQTAVRRTAAKILASLLSGLIFAPMVVRYINIDINSDSLIFVAGTTSFLAVGVLEGLAPFLIGRIRDWIQKKVDPSKEP